MFSRFEFFESSHTHTHIVRIILRHYADTNTIHEHAWEQTTEQDILAL